MRNSPLYRSYLYVPGDNEQRIYKAMDSTADAVVIDLEDAVAPQRKEIARNQVTEILATHVSKPIFVRINSVQSGLAYEDLKIVLGTNLTGIRIPKVETSSHVIGVANFMSNRGCDAVIHCLIESAKGVQNVTEIVASNERVTGLGIGEADLIAELNSKDEGIFSYIRSRTVIAAHAAGILAPTQGVYTRIDDMEGLRISTEMGKDMGFFGRSAIHPKQLDIINHVFTPTSDEINRALGVIKKYEESLERGIGAMATEDGEFLDKAIVEQARKKIDLVNYLKKD